MGRILKKAKEGFKGDLVAATILLILAAIAWPLSDILWHSGFKILMMFSAIFLIAAILASAVGLYLLVTEGIIRLPQNVQSIAQIVVALVVAITPPAYLLLADGHVEVQTILIEAFALFFTPIDLAWMNWLIFGFYIFAVYQSSSRIEPLLPVRRYLVLAAGAFCFVYIGAHGGFQTTDEYGFPDSSSADPIDPKSREGQIRMVANYLRLATLGYGALLYVDWNRWRRRKQLAQMDNQMGKLPS